MAAISAISDNHLADSPLNSSLSLPSSTSSSSSTASTGVGGGEFDSCEGYLVVTFSKSAKPQSTSNSLRVENSPSIEPTTPLTINAGSPQKVGTRISRLAAMAAGVDISQLQHSSASSSAHPSSSSTITSISSSSISPPSSFDYVRRFTYPDGDTHYDWLSCPLADMQAKGPLTNSVKSSTFPRKPSFLVYDSTLPNTSNSAAPSPHPPTISISHSTSVSTYRRQLSTSRKMLRCEECGKYYGNEYSLHHHICLRRKDVWKKGDVPTRLIDGQLTYFCPMCNKPFKWLGNLTRHYYVHTGQRFFKCDICRKEFFSAYQVRRHMNSHTGLRFQCTICDKPFTCKYACAWHMRQHFKELDSN